MIEYEQEFYEFWCKMCKDFRKFVSHANDPEIIICCKCGFTMQKKKAITRTKSEEEEKRRKARAWGNSYYYKLMEDKNDKEESIETSDW